jgi:hypothetical protein
MSGSLGAARLLVLAFGLTMLAGGLAVMATGVGGAFVAGIWMVGFGVAVIVGTLIERVRYRSDATERAGGPTGPGGGEPPGTMLEPRFHRSDEVFTDPTSGRRMRVWTDPSSGERRYVAED